MDQEETGELPANPAYKPTYATGTAIPYGKQLPRSASANPYYGQPQPPVVPPRVKARKAKRTVGILVGVFAGAMVVLCAIGVVVAGVAGDPNRKPDPRLSGVTKMPPTAATSGPVANGQAAVAVPSAEPSAKASSATEGIPDEGTLLVPSEVKPGTYRATVPGESFGCYWARLKGTSNEIENIIANGNSKPGAKVTVTVKATDKAFHSQGCGVWSKI